MDDFIGWDVVRIAFNRHSIRPVRRKEDCVGTFFKSAPSKKQVQELPIQGKPGAASTAGAWNNPLESDALACHPSQVKEFNEYAKTIPGAYYKPDGTCVFESRSARRRLMKLRGVHDRNGGYGDG